MLAPALLRHASEEQKLEYLPKLLSAELTFCQLFSEPGWAPTSLHSALVLFVTATSSS